MGLFRRRSGSAKRPPDHVPPEDMLDTTVVVECPHTDLGAHWANAADVGQHDKITGYQCGGCMRIFTVEEHDELLKTEATRLAWLKERPPDELPRPEEQKEAPPAGG
jgi:hypothetical protein